MDHRDDYAEQVLFDIGTVLSNYHDTPLTEKARLCDKIAFQSGMLYQALSTPNNKLRIIVLLMAMASMCIHAIVSMRAGTFNFEKEYEDTEE